MGYFAHAVSAPCSVPVRSCARTCCYRDEAQDECTAGATRCSGRAFRRDPTGACNCRSLRAIPPYLLPGYPRRESCKERERQPDIAPRTPHISSSKTLFGNVSHTSTDIILHIIFALPTTLLNSALQGHAPHYLFFLALGETDWAKGDRCEVSVYDIWAISAQE